ncbi:hypothetical protein Alches_18640 [Alicyclobacillus hesperidum subsp. aegles]|uniref:DUF2213 domain-containing protein n=1 Tax=Alicyclobacillus hesperidum TaxID=89784 RepID=UPI00222DBE2A|nr:DUF2213 domain-containing protein [Alicyclobacillus hesperidum]GLG01823.1 hypothetical protein Alches_18640 [Alicyclobacillus hesperidum subsp. aegles]
MRITTKAYYASRFSPNLSFTPEGFLIAQNVSISRAGWYEYLESEIGLPGNNIVRVFRPPEEVFSAAAMASFEGKPVTDRHPPDGVSPEDAAVYVKGTARNVRRGTGEDSDLLFADLIIYDKRLIDEIMGGKREVSAGYECDYVPQEDGTYLQVNIVGNHVAVVERGRAGDRVRIHDEDNAEEVSKRYGIAVKKDGHRSPPEGYPQNRDDYADPVNYKYPIDSSHLRSALEFYNRTGEREAGDYTPEEWRVIGRRIVARLEDGYELKDGKIQQKTTRTKGADHMKVKLPHRKQSRVTDVLAAIGLKHFAADAEPDEIVDAVDAMAEERVASQEPDTTADADPTSPDTERMDALEKKLDALTELVQKLAESKAATSDEETPEEAIDAAIAQMEDPENTPPRTDDDDPEEDDAHLIDPGMVEDEAGPIAPPEDRPRSGFTAADTATKIAALRAIKPVIAAISDPVAKKKAADAAIAAIKGRPTTNTYGQIQRATRRHVADRQRASGGTQPPQDLSQLGMEWARKYNPHYKNVQ